MAYVQALKEFDGLLSQVVETKKLSATKITKLTEMAVELIEFDTYLVTALYRLHRTLPPCSQEKINSLYCFDSISRACRSKVKRGIGARIEKTGTFAGFLQQVEGVLDGLIEDLVGKADWKEGRDKALKILDIWTKSLTFPPDVLKRLTDRTELAIANAASNSASSSAGPSSSTVVPSARDDSERRGSADRPDSRTAPAQPTQAPIAPRADPRRPQAPGPTWTSEGGPSSSLTASAAAGPPPSTSTPPLPNIPADLLALLHSATNGKASPQGAGNVSQPPPATPTYTSQPMPYAAQPPPPPPQHAPTPLLTLDASALALLGQLSAMNNGPPQPQSYPQAQLPPSRSQAFPPYPPSGAPDAQPGPPRNDYPLQSQRQPYPPAPFQSNGRPPYPPPQDQSFASNGGPSHRGGPPSYSNGGPSLSSGPQRGPPPPPPQQQGWNGPPPPSGGWNGSPPSQRNQRSPAHPSSYDRPPQQSWGGPSAPSSSGPSSYNDRPRSPPRHQRQPSYDAPRGGPPPPQQQQQHQQQHQQQQQPQQGRYPNSNAPEDHGGWADGPRDGRGPGGPPRTGGQGYGEGQDGRPGGAGGPGPGQYDRQPVVSGGRGGYEGGAGRGGFSSGPGPSARGPPEPERRISGGRSRWDVAPSRDGRSPPRPPPNASDYIGGRPQASPVPPASLPSAFPTRSPAYVPPPPPVRAPAPPPPAPPIAAPFRPPAPPSAPYSAPARPFIHPSRLGIPDARPAVSTTPVAPGLDEFGRAIRQTSADAEDEGPPKTRAKLSADVEAVKKEEEEDEAKSEDMDLDEEGGV